MANSTFQPTELNPAVWMSARAHGWLKGKSERGAFSSAMETSSSERTPNEAGNGEAADD